MFGIVDVYQVRCVVATIYRARHLPERALLLMVVFILFFKWQPIYLTLLYAASLDPGCSGTLSPSPGAAGAFLDPGCSSRLFPTLDATG